MPQGQVKGGVMGCTAMRDTSFKDSLTIKINTGGKDVDMIIRMSSEADFNKFLNVFKSHLEYYKDKQIPFFEERCLVESLYLPRI